MDLAGRIFYGLVALAALASFGWGTLAHGGEGAAFALFATLVIGGSLMCIWERSVVRSAFCLLGTFGGGHGGPVRSPPPQEIAGDDSHQHTGEDPGNNIDQRIHDARRSRRKSRYNSISEYTLARAGRYEQGVSAWKTTRPHLWVDITR